MARYRYEHIGSAWRTVDGKVLLRPSVQGVQYCIYAENSITSEENKLLIDAGLLSGRDLVTITPSERVPFMRTVQAFLRSHGYDLNLRCTQQIWWTTADHEWRLWRTRNIDGQLVWEIRPSGSNHPIPVPVDDRPFFHTRDAAVDWAVADECKRLGC